MCHDSYERESLTGSLAFGLTFHDGALVGTGLGRWWDTNTVGIASMSDLVTVVDLAEIGAALGRVLARPRATSLKQSAGARGEATKEIAEVEVDRDTDLEIEFDDGSLFKRQ